MFSCGNDHNVLLILSPDYLCKKLKGTVKHTIMELKYLRDKIQGLSYAYNDKTKNNYNMQQPTHGGLQVSGTSWRD